MKTLKLLGAALAAVTMVFSAQAAKTAKVVVANSGKTLKFVYDEKDYGTKGTDWFAVADAEARDPGLTPSWCSRSSSVTAVEIDGSFCDYRPKHCGNWFYGFSSLKTISGLYNLNTVDVTSFKCMFDGCSQLASLDIRLFVTYNATDMYRMFFGCSSLVSIDLSGFDTTMVTNMGYMFYGCSKLEVITVSDRFVTAAVTLSLSMFSNCTALIGAKGTKYSSGYSNDKTYARMDGGTSAPGYFRNLVTAKAVLQDDGKTLKFVFDSSNYGTKNEKWFSVFEAENIEPIGEVPQWSSRRTTVTKVIFDPSFGDYRPKQCSDWFWGFAKLQTIEKLWCLITSSTRDFTYMFSGCESLTALDVSGFDTSSAESFYAMFFPCPKLTSLNVAGFRTDRVVDMGFMFSGCSKLTSLDLSGFDTARVEDMASMFENCTAIKTIYASDRFVTDQAIGSSSMFSGCTALVGDKGTAYDSSKTDKTYARIDGGASAPGYFTALPMMAKAVVEGDGTVLRFVYDNRTDYGLKDTGWYSVAEAEAINPYDDEPAWYAYNDAITKVVFDPSFAAYRPKQCGSWFYYFTALKQIEGIENLNTSEVGEFAYMFDNCRALASLDLTGFDTTSATGFVHMLSSCTKLKSLDLSRFNTAKVVDMRNMFSGCASLASLDLSRFDTSRVEDMSSMFSGCNSLESLDISRFDTANVVDMSYMFGSCSSLTAILASKKFVTDRANYSTGMFSGCTALVGGAGTAYDSTKTDKTYARIDGKDGLPGYFTSAIPTLFDSFAPGALNPKGATYNGFLGDETLGGTFTLVVKKPKKGSTAGAATLTKVDPATGKKVKITGTVDVNTGVCGGDLAGLQLNARGVGGSLGGVPAQGAVDAAKAKDQDALAVMNGFNKQVYGLVFADAAGEEAYLTATFSTKGKVKVAGSYRGAKVSGSSTMCVGDAVCAVPFVWSKKGVRVSFVLWFDKATRTLVDVSGLGAGATLVDAGLAGGSAATYPFVLDETAVRASVPDAIDKTFIPLTVAFNGKKFDAGKAAKVSYKKGDAEPTVDTSKGDNVTGLKLSYSKGVLKGSFTVYAVTAGKLVKNKFTVAGVLINGVGYAAGTNRKLPAIPFVLAK